MVTDHPDAAVSQYLRCSNALHALRDVLVDDGVATRIEVNNQYYDENPYEPVNRSDVDPNLLRPDVEATVDGEVVAASERAAAELAGAYSPSTVARRDANRKFYVPRLSGPECLEELALMVDPILLSIAQDHGENPGYAERAARNILQNGQTTTYAVALLLAHGYVIDAEARWRGIYELACSASVLAKSSDIEQVSKRYLVHGRMLPDWDPAYRQPWAIDDFQSANYSWMRLDYPTGQLTQRRLFQEGALDGAPFQDWIRGSHQPVHMSSTAVAEGSTLVGGAPPGYAAERAESIACRAACTLHEIVANTALILGRSSHGYDPNLLAWPTAFHDATTERVGWMLAHGELPMYAEGERLESVLLADAEV